MDGKGDSIHDIPPDQVIDLIRRQWSGRHDATRISSSASMQSTIGECCDMGGARCDGWKHNDGCSMYKDGEDEKAPARWSG